METPPRPGTHRTRHRARRQYLDTQRQILAYALVFGYAQQLATWFVDDRATTLLTEVPSKHMPPTQTRSLPPAMADPRESAASAREASPIPGGSGGNIIERPSTNGRLPRLFE